MARVRAAVLAAGRGVRMGGARPKALIPLNGHEPLMHYVMKGLARAGVTDVLVVTGFGASEIQAYTTEHSEGADVGFVFNARYASWGNFHSVRMALDQSPGYDVLVVNCDVVVNPEVYGRVAETGGDLVLAVEKRLRLDEEDMRVRLEGDRVRAIGKSLARAHSHGEYDGVSLIRAAAARAYSEAATAMEWQRGTALYYEDVYARILDRVDARAAFVAAGEYAEVDEPADVPDAVGVVERYTDAWAI